MRGLSAKQERFAQLVFAGYSLANAYRSAYSTRGASATVRVEASRLAANRKIVARIAEFRAVAATPAVMANLNRRMELARAVRWGLHPRALIRAVREDAILAGDRPRRVSFRPANRLTPAQEAFFDSLSSSPLPQR